MNVPFKHREPYKTDCGLEFTLNYQNCETRNWFVTSDVMTVPKKNNDATLSQFGDLVEISERKNFVYGQLSCQSPKLGNDFKNIFQWTKSTFLFSTA